MDLSKLRTGGRIAAVAAILLLLDLFLNWYAVDIGQAFGGFAAAAGVNTSLSAWEVFDFTDILLFAIVLATLTLLALEAFGSGVRLPVPGSTIIAVLGGVATVWVLWRMINQPGPDGLVDLKFGAYLGLLFSAGIAFGGWQGMREEGVTFDDARAQAERAVPGRRQAQPQQPATPAPIPPPAEAPEPESVTPTESYPTGEPAQAPPGGASDEPAPPAPSRPSEEPPPAAASGTGAGPDAVEPPASWPRSETPPAPPSGTAA